MPNAVKYKTGNLTGSLQKGNVALGVSGSFGPTSTTGWYNGPNPVASKYQIFETAVSGDPEVYSPQDDAELIKFARWKGATGADTGSAAAVLAWIGTQTNLMAANFQYEGIVTDGLVLNLDAGFVGGYPTTGSTWYDLSGNNNSGSLINGPTFNSGNSGSIVFDGVDDYTSLGNIFNYTSESFSFGYWVNFNSFNTNVPGQGPITFYKGAFNTNGYYLQHSTNYFSFVTNQSGSNQTTTINGVNTLGVWHYIVVTRNGSSVRGYVNGVDNTSTVASHTNPASSTNNFTLARYASSIYFNGKISNFTGYNRALTAAEVQQNYNAQKGRFGL